MPFHGSICATGVSSSGTSAGLSRARGIEGDDWVGMSAEAALLTSPSSSSVCVVASSAVDWGAAEAATAVDAAHWDTAGGGLDLTGSMVPNSTIRS
eukprot:scaffold35436_cov66-Phaeocystis_antarctica.AAC.2